MIASLSPTDRAKYICAARAAEFVQSGMKVGLGTGSTAAWLVKVLGEKVQKGELTFQGVPTSTRTDELARQVGIEVITLQEAGWLDVTIDGADEFDSALNLIKGGGGALLQEKIVAKASDRMIVIADAAKRVDALGAFPLPVEVTPFGWPLTQKHVANTLADLGYEPKDISPRMNGDALYVTDEGNHILDIKMGVIKDAPLLAATLNNLAGVVETGLFIDICSSVVIGHEDGRAELTDLANGTQVDDRSALLQEKNIFADL